MDLTNKRIGYAITGSFCTFKYAIDMAKELTNTKAIITPIFSRIVATTDTRFYLAQNFYNDITAITGNLPITTIEKAEPIGPKQLFDLIIVAPATGNTLAKLAYGITDTPTTMAVKAHLRNDRPVVIGLSTNDGLGNSAKNIGHLLTRKNYYFIPFRQDNFEKKPTSLVADFSQIIPTVELAFQNKQIQPILANNL